MKINLLLSAVIAVLLLTSCAKEDALNFDLELRKGPVTAQPGKKCLPEVSAIFNCDCVDVTSTKDLSNVVIQLASGDIKFDDLDQGYTGTFCSPNSDPSGGVTGETILGVWIKSGCNSSGDGPGYGEYIPAIIDSGVYCP